MSFSPSLGRATDRHPSSASEIQRLRASKLAELALKRYGLSDARLQFLRQGFVQVFRVVSPSKGEFALRMYSTPAASLQAEGGTSSVTSLRSAETLRSQLMWMKALGREMELLVPEPVPMADGSLMNYVSFDDLPLHRKLLRRVWAKSRRVYHPHHSGRYSVLLRWVPGEHKEENLAPADLSQLGSCVAELHNHAQSYRAPKGTVLPRWDWEWPFGEGVPLWSKGEARYSSSEMEVFWEVARCVREDLDRLGEDREVFGIIHRDLKLDNVVFDGERVGVIDFDMCGWGYYLYDLSVIRRSLTHRYVDRLKPLWEAFLEGYHSKRSLPENYERYLETFDAMQRVASVNRTLELLASEATRHQVRRPRFLRNAVTQLERNYLRDER